MSKIKKYKDEKKKKKKEEHKLIHFLPASYEFSNAFGKHREVYDGTVRRKSNNHWKKLLDLKN